MTRALLRAAPPRVLPLAAALLLTAWLTGAYAPPAVAQADQDAPAATDEFSQQLDAFKKTITDLSQKIDEGAKTIDGMTEVDKARKEIVEMRAAVGTLLASVADNGTVAQLGAKALNRTKEKLRGLEQESRFKPEERQYLIERWRELNQATERATEELGEARKQLVEILRTLQSNEDFIDELVELRQSKKALEIIRQLTASIRGASDKLKTLIGGIKPPGA
jgi:Mg2+ and Co2+ transporter CorA